MKEDRYLIKKASFQKILCAEEKLKGDIFLFHDIIAVLVPREKGKRFVIKVIQNLFLKRYLTNVIIRKDGRSIIKLCSMGEWFIKSKRIPIFNYNNRVENHYSLFFCSRKI